MSEIGKLVIKGVGHERKRELLKLNWLAKSYK